MKKEDLLPTIATELGLTIQTGDGVMELLAEKINELLLSNFDKLISILYRMDVSETKLNNLLKEHPGEDAGKLIAALMLEREWQRQQSREQFKKSDGDIPEAEKW